MNKFEYATISIKDNVFSFYDGIDIFKKHQGAYNYYLTAMPNPNGIFIYEPYIFETLLNMISEFGWEIFQKDKKLFYLKRIRNDNYNQMAKAFKIFINRLEDKSELIHQDLIHNLLRADEFEGVEMLLNRNIITYEDGTYSIHRDVLEFNVNMPRIR